MKEDSLTAKQTAAAWAEPLTALAAGMNHAMSSLGGGDAAQMKGLEAISASFTAALSSAETTRAHLASASARAIQGQIAATTAFASVKTPQEAFELQAQFARKALDAYTADVTALGGLMIAAFEASLKPLTERADKPA
ncbi:phasin family protein [Phenylobacterium sp. LjRoot219]|uniref:phasin family protein n=1 Tax=Phenylobacterium sp. LjRoot219 TaxID=3342283 RepID=UPI003ECE7E50